MRKGLFGGQTSSLERLLALTDGIYAIVLTLLVLDLKIPEAPEVSNVELMADLDSSDAEFHRLPHQFFGDCDFLDEESLDSETAHQGNETVFWLNLLHVFFLSLLPYTSSLVGHYEQDSLAVMIFSGSLGLCGLSLLFLHRYVVGKPEWVEELPVKPWTAPNWWIDYPAPFIALGSIGLAFLNIHAALAIWVLAPMWAALLVLFRR
ncbi:MAG: TMEM175 family protein [Nitrospirales bacterium]